MVRGFIGAGYVRFGGAATVSTPQCECGQPPERLGSNPHPRIWGAFPMSEARSVRSVARMLHDPSIRRLFAESRSEELRRHAKPRVLQEPDDEARQPGSGFRLRRLFPR